MVDALRATFYCGRVSDKAFQNVRPMLLASQINRPASFIGHRDLVMGHFLPTRNTALKR